MLGRILRVSFVDKKGSQSEHDELRGGLHGGAHKLRDRK